MLNSIWIGKPFCIEKKKNSSLGLIDSWSASKCTYTTGSSRCRAIRSDVVIPTEPLYWQSDGCWTAGVPKLLELCWSCLCCLIQLSFIFYILFPSIISSFSLFSHSPRLYSMRAGFTSFTTRAAFKWLCIFIWTVPASRMSDKETKISGPPRLSFFTGLSLFLFFFYSNSQAHQLKV